MHGSVRSWPHHGLQTNVVCPSLEKGFPGISPAFTYCLLFAKWRLSCNCCSTIHCFQFLSFIKWFLVIYGLCEPNIRACTFWIAVLFYYDYLFSFTNSCYEKSKFLFTFTRVVIKSIKYAKLCKLFKFSVFK